MAILGKRKADLASPQHHRTKRDRHETGTEQERQQPHFLGKRKADLGWQRQANPKRDRSRVSREEDQIRYTYFVHLKEYQQRIAHLEREVAAYQRVLAALR